MSNESKTPTTTDTNKPPEKEPTYIDGIVKSFQDSKDKKQALSELESSIPSGENAGVHCEFLSAIYSSGIKDFGIDKNEEKCKKYLNDGAKAGSTSCMISLGDMVSEKEPGRARSLLESALNAKDFRAANSLGVLAMKQQNVDDALAKFELANSHEVPNAANNLAITRLQKAAQGLNDSANLIRQVMAQFSNASRAANK